MLKVQNLQIPNLKSIDFSLNSGELMILTGTSGSGKTLLLQALAGLIPCTFDRFSYQGEFYETLDWPKIRTQILYLQQKPVRIKGLVDDILRQPFSYKVNKEKKLDETQLENYLRELNLNRDFLSKEANHLSGGEEQMMAILRSLLMNPQILLLDEPTAAIDRERTLIVEKLILSWKNNSALNPSIIFITHDEAQEQRLLEHSGKLVDFNQLVRK